MNIRKLILSSGVANTFEWYDYALFAHFAPVIGDKFFPNEDHSVSVLHAFLAFAVGYVMRPIGGIFFGTLGDRFGRRAALSAAVICMSFPTAVIGMMPTYDSVGMIATVVMIIMRILQGLSMGGALTGSVSFIIEHAGRNRRGIASSISMCSICLGLLLGSMVSYLVKISLTTDQFYSWGWRIPFLIGIIILFAGLYIRHYMPETPEFIAMKDNECLARSPMKRVLSLHKCDMLISIGINMTGSVVFYLHAVYLVTFLKIARGFNDTDVTILANVCYLIMACVTVFMGWLSDVVERRKILIINLILTIVTIPLILKVLAIGSFRAVIVAQVMLALLAGWYIGPEPALQAEFYPAPVRNTALSTSYNMATSLFGGTTPYIIEYMVQYTGTVESSAYYIICACIIGIVALGAYKNRSQ